MPTRATTSSSAPRTRRSTRVAITDASPARLRAYLDALSPEARAELQALRDRIRKVAPTAVEEFAYGIPAFRLNGKPFVYCAVWARHLSLYPIGDAIKAAHAEALEGYTVSKGTVQFPRGVRLPMTLITRLLKARQAEMGPGATPAGRTGGRSNTMRTRVV